MVFLAGELPYIRSYTMYIYDSGQPYTKYISITCRVRVHHKEDRHQGRTLS